MMKYRVVSMALLLLTSACASIPEPLQVSDSTSLTDYASVRQAPEQSIGQAARWGGVIANITNHANNTVLEVVHFPLTRSAKPIQQDQTLGRFKVSYQGLLDPMIYQKGRSITAVGTLALMEMGKIGEHEYQYPVIAAEHVYLWKNIQEIDINIWPSAYWHQDRLWRPYYPYYPRPIVVRKPSSPTKAPAPKSTSNKVQVQR